MPNLDKFVHYHSNAIESDTYITPEDEVRVAVPDKKGANLISSETVPGSQYHYLFLDLDVPHQYIPSSTEGHGHLIIEKRLYKDVMWKILNLLKDAGVLENGFVDLAERRGAVFLRHPDHPKKKEMDLIDEDDDEVKAVNEQFATDLENALFDVPPNLV